MKWNASQKLKGLNPWYIQIVGTLKTSPPGKVASSQQSAASRASIIALSTEHSRSSQTIIAEPRSAFSCCGNGIGNWMLTGISRRNRHCFISNWDGDPSSVRFGQNPSNCTAQPLRGAGVGCGGAERQEDPGTSWPAWLAKSLNSKLNERHLVEKEWCNVQLMKMLNGDLCPPNTGAHRYPPVHARLLTQAHKWHTHTNQCTSLFIIYTSVVDFETL